MFDTTGSHSFRDRAGRSTRATEVERRTPGSRFQRRPSQSEDERERALLAAATTAAQRGDDDALRWLYLRYKDNVYGYVCSIVCDEHEAEDVTQQVFARLLLVLDRYEQRPDVSFTAWLLRLARNAAIDHVRQRRDTVPHEDQETRAAGTANADVIDLQEALATLPNEQRHVLVLRHVVGLSPGEIADHLGKTESSIHGLHHRGRHALRRELTRMGLAPMARRQAEQCA
jgi:RNA polymerase sigma-70 factor (ECF subfamily)